MDKTRQSASDDRRAELAAMTPKQLAAILMGLNPFGGYSATTIAKHRQNYIESILIWEGLA